MAHNRYFIVDATDPNMDEIMNVAIGELNTQRLSLDGSLMVIKLHDDDHNSYPFLSAYTEYSHHAILEVMATPEWSQIEQDV